MAVDKTVNQQTQDSSPTTDDFILTWDTGSGASKKVAVSDLLLLSNPYKFRAYRNAAANTGNGAFAVVAMDTEQFDTGNNLVAGVFTAPINGFYQFNGEINVSNAAGVDVAVGLHKNGSEYSRGGQVSGTNANNSLTVNDLIQLTAGDTVDLRAYAATTKALNVGNIYQNYFSGYLMSKA